MKELNQVIFVMVLTRGESKRIKSDDMSTQVINTVMRELGYKRTQSHGKRYYEHIVENEGKYNEHK